MPAIEANGTAEISARAAAQLNAAVRDAGSLALSMFGKPIKQWTKGPSSSPVSEADIAIDALLRERLTGNAFAWLSEETADDAARLAARYVWVVDPIDGTRAYIAGQPDWAISAALIEQSRPIAACLYAPALDEFFAARAGAGSTLNGVAIAAAPGAALRGICIAGPQKFLERLNSILPPFTKLPRGHSLALRLARVAQGTCDAAFAGGNSHDWDLAAADLLVHEAGGALTPLAGGAIAYNRPVPRHGTLIAAGRDRHAALVGLLGDERLALR
ncbi:MAG TPA: 3'(2'),5'-bisphosphate nucleotidase CysQ [Xanthobacteraceae bacterium]|nr:3'(2'),5'-bisphosphate nucleotidase CysQ [Xanthobacteraceae bacterium]